MKYSLKELRARLGLTQAEMAERLGISTQITKLRATEKTLEETKIELARTREELHNAKKRIEEVTANRRSGYVGKNITLPDYVLKEAQIVTEIQELLADEIKAQLSKGACTREIVQLVEPFAKLRIKG